MACNSPAQIRKMREKPHAWIAGSVRKGVSEYPPRAPCAVPKVRTSKPHPVIHAPPLRQSGRIANTAFFIPGCHNIVQTCRELDAFTPDFSNGVLSDVSSSSICEGVCWEFSVWWGVGGMWCGLRGLMWFWKLVSRCVSQR